MSSSPVHNPPVEGPYLCDGCDLEYATHDEAAACESKHLQENDDMRRRDKIKMLFATLLRKQEDVPGNDKVKRFAKVITDIIKGGRTPTILQSRVLLFEYLDDIRVEVVTSSDNDIFANDFDDEKGIGSNLVDQIMKTAMEMNTIQPQQPSKWFGDIANATSTTTMPTFAVGVAGPSTTSSLARHGLLTHYVADSNPPRLLYSILMHRYYSAKLPFGIEQTWTQLTFLQVIRLAALPYHLWLGLRMIRPRKSQVMLLSLPCQ